ncbi:hypothetical protein E1265_04780 [Streptomyces sp. 8K308]|uniref:hypothetical protein n=1 Tax=Streptomyces sp. 8K308 TaxID=2530388 RepID=UPI0010430BEE|nr:hypothetical protein [Streptomyces sp. 8K308]TDC26247.1 hypothetical protein E1265_04780 [Streptomyces sp. 8K308]
MSGMQGWPGAGYPPAPGPGGGPANTADNSGKRFGIWAGVIVLTVAASFGLAAATGADARGGGASAAAPSDLPTFDGTDGLEDLEDFETPGDTGLGDGSGSGGIDDSSGGGGGLETTAPTPETPSDPTLDAFLAVSQGDCLANWMTDETTWSSDIPEVVSCDDEAAALWVSQTSEFAVDCAAGPGQSYFSYTSYGAEVQNIYLCVTRQFDVGQCFLGMSDGSANLLSWVDCEGSIAPPYSQLYNVTAVYDAPANTDGEECRSASGDDFWWWTLDNDSVLLCAVIYR